MERERLQCSLLVKLRLVLHLVCIIVYRANDNDERYTGNTINNARSLLSKFDGARNLLAQDVFVLWNLKWNQRATVNRKQSYTFYLLFSIAVSVGANAEKMKEGWGFLFCTTS